MASVLEKFLPVLDDFSMLETKYGEHDFGKSFNALGGAMRGAFKELGVTEYTVEVGSKVDRQRVNVVGEEYSEEFDKDTIIRPVTMGMELQGNVIRMAECVASLGSESEQEEAEEEESFDEAVPEEEGSSEEELCNEGAPEEDEKKEE